MEVACRRLARFPAWECLFSRPIHRFSQCRLFSDPSAAAAVRVAKRIASSHGCSRRDAEKLILEGRVRVNGAVLSSPAVVVSPSDVVLVDGEFVKESPPPKVWLCYKLPGEIVTRKDPEGRHTLFERLAAMNIPGHAGLKSVGRLDFKSEGLLLLTSSGEVSRYLELPSTGIIRKYSVRVAGNVTEHALKSLKRGVYHEGHRYRAVNATIAGHSGEHTWLDVTLTEGKNREIRKLMRVFGLTVDRLIRVQYGPYELGKLPRGSVLQVPLHSSIKVSRPKPSTLEPNR